MAAATMPPPTMTAHSLPSISQLLARRSPATASTSASSRSGSPPDYARRPSSSPVPVRHASLPPPPRADRESSAGLELLCDIALAESLPIRSSSSSLRPVPTRVHSRSPSPYARPLPVRDGTYVPVPGIDGPATTTLPRVIVAQLKAKRAIDALEGRKPPLSTSHVERLEVWERCPMFGCVGTIVSEPDSRHCALCSTAFRPAHVSAELAACPRLACAGMCTAELQPEQGMIVHGCSTCRTVYALEPRAPLFEDPARRQRSN